MNKDEKKPLPADAPPSPAEIRHAAERKVIQAYYNNDGEWCKSCSCYFEDTEVGFYCCKVLSGELPTDYAECL